MDITTEVESFKQIPIFAKVDPARLKLLAFMSERHTFKVNDWLIHEGEIGTCAYILIEGNVDVLVNVPDGQIKVAELTKNAIVGEIGIMSDLPRIASVRASTPVDTLCISKDVFLSLVSEFPEVALEIINVLAKRLDQLNKRLMKSSSASSK